MASAEVVVVYRSDSGAAYGNTRGFRIDFDASTTSANVDWTPDLVDGHEYSLDSLTLKADSSNTTTTPVYIGVYTGYNAGTGIWSGFLGVSDQAYDWGTPTVDTALKYTFTGISVTADSVVGSGSGMLYFMPQYGTQARTTYEITRAVCKWDLGMAGVFANIIGDNNAIVADRAPEYAAQLTSMLLKPHNPIPANNAVGVGTVNGANADVTLGWDAAASAEQTVRENIVDQYVFMRATNSADPNIYYVGATGVDPENTPASTYGPVALNFDTSYQWVVVEALEGYEQNFTPGVSTLSSVDPNNITGHTWTFKTLGVVPEITTQPVSVKVDGGQTAQFSIAYISNTSVSVVWYKDGSPLTAGGNVTIVFDDTASTLSIASADSGDEAGYYAVVTNSAGSAPQSQTAYLRLKQRLAWYQFEQNLNDSAGTNHATDTGNVAYTAGMITTDSQAYAADPNGSNYGLLSATAYPKTGFGNGLDTFTYECWVKLAAGEGGVIMGTFNDGTTTGFRFSVNGAENNISAHVRQEGGQFVQPATASLATDSQWHHIVLTYDGAAMKIFVDGTWKTTATGTVTNFAAWQYPIALLARNSRGTILEGFSGQVDDLQIFNYALTTDQVAQTYLGVQGGWVCNRELPLLTYDYDNNCQVDIGDFVIFAADWLDSNRIYAH
jgi:hypothetical protein